MAKRKIVVFSNAIGKNKVLESEARTWGELKAELGDLATGNIEAVVKGTRNTLNLDGAELPTTEFTVMLVAKKMKSGARAKKQDALTDLNKTQLKKVAKNFGLKTDGDAPAILKRLRNKQKSLGSEFTPEEITHILGGEKAPKTKAKEEATAVVENATEAVKGGDLTVDEAKASIKDIMETAKGELLSVIDRIKVTTVQEGIDLFEGLEGEWKEIQDEVKKKG